MREPRWGLGDVAIGLVPFALGAVSLVGAEASTDPVQLSALVGGSLFVWVFLVGVPVVATKVKGNGLVADLGLRFRAVDGLAFVGGAILQAALPYLYVPLLELLGRTAEDVEAEARRVVEGTTGAGIALLVLVVCIGAPFAEELFFRGLLLRATDRRFGPTVAIVASAVVFGLSHLQGIQLPALLLVGVFAAVLAVRSGRLGPAMLFHAGFNAWSLLQILVLDPR